MKRQLHFIKYLLFHPVDGFWEMKREKKGSLVAAVILIALWIVTNIFKRQMTGFLFNYVYSPLDVVAEIRNVLIITVLFCIANWAVTTLLDGESTMRDIFMMFGYSCIPITLIGIPVTILSNFTTYNESAYIDFFLTISVIWTVALIFVGVMTINQYSPLKTFAIGLITIVTVAVIIFICILFYSILNQLAGFFIAVYKEINLRI